MLTLFTTVLLKNKYRSHKFIYKIKLQKCQKIQMKKELFRQISSGKIYKSISFEKRTEKRENRKQKTGIYLPSVALKSK